MEPSTGIIAGLLGKVAAAKISMVLASFIGALLSPALIKGLTRVQMCVSVAVGFWSSIYGTPVAVRYLEWNDEPELSYALAFFIGLFAMTVIPIGQSWLKRKAEAKS